jgi:outer membrane protein OmpA-like peptidoglycan-associated protein
MFVKRGKYFYYSDQSIIKLITMKNPFVVILVLFALGLGALTACNWNNAQKGGAIGAGAGAGVGAVIGAQSKNTAIGAIIGAAVGGAAGALIGNYMDKQAKELQEDLKNAKVERVGEGIKITFDSGILFNIDSYKLSETSLTNLGDLSKTLQKYNDTNILIEGHTDSTGTEEHNKILSEHRAVAVADFLKSYGVSGTRITTNGYGEDQPVASNATPEGRQQNRRVDIAIFANKKLQRAAEKGEVSTIN